MAAGLELLTAGLVEEKHWEVAEIENLRFNPFSLSKPAEESIAPAFQRTGPGVCCR
ncbi:MAG TPA: hypothetical protein VHY84_27895 [Bryobacteraceae bacterium]|jgi:hypothetical protein|nr:hypothetical protein [Bryobacteraceae bacterium]